MKIGIPTLLASTVLLGACSSSPDVSVGVNKLGSRVIVGDVRESGNGIRTVMFDLYPTSTLPRYRRVAIACEHLEPKEGKVLILEYKAEIYRAQHDTAYLAPCGE